MLEYREMEKQEMINRLAQIEAEAEAIRKNLERPQNVKPRKGGWEIFSPGCIFNRAGAFIRFTPAWHCYATQDQAAWQSKAEEVRRRAQQIAAAAYASSNETCYGAWALCWAGYQTGIMFPSPDSREDCVRQLGLDIVYLHWPNSPEFKDSLK